MTKKTTKNNENKLSFKEPLKEFAFSEDVNMQEDATDQFVSCQAGALPEDEFQGPGDNSSVSEELAQEKAKSEDYYNQMLRLQAEFDNFRKRVVKEKEDLLRYGGEQLIIQFLPVLDSFDQAITVSNTDAESLYEGIQMIAKQMKEVLLKEGVEAIETIGEPFNPEFHEAVMTEESPDYSANTVMMELRSGYTYKGKVIRAAMVKVAG
ncbi:MAG: nucleotide exchange factor GrpE [Peptococcaceae bacterium]|nr:nucleotide exchange factor GrpE [Peptococcaceae bacterium]